MRWRWIAALLLLSTGASTHAQQRDCHPSYPDFCIPPPPPDLDCPDFRQCNFRVVGDDPHRLDHDRDGRACENNCR
jgi:hypothetical protein